MRSEMVVSIRKKKKDLKVELQDHTVEHEEI